VFQSKYSVAEFGSISVALVTSIITDREEPVLLGYDVASWVT